MVMMGSMCLVKLHRRPRLSGLLSPRVDKFGPYVLETMGRRTLSIWMKETVR